MSAEETKPLVDPSTAASVAVAGVSAINESAEKIAKAKFDGPLTFRMLGFVGGWAMIVSNAIGIPDRFFSFNFTGCLTAFYGFWFGILSTYFI